MGFIEIASVNSPEELSGIWNTYFDLEKISAAGKSVWPSQDISDGERFFVGKSQSVIVFSGNKVSDYITGPGAFLFHSAFEPFKYTVRSRECFESVYRKYPEIFATYFGDVRLLVINQTQPLRIPFSFSDAVYYDKKYNLNINMQGTGFFEIGIENTLEYLAESDFKTDIFDRRLSLGENDEHRISAEFSELVKSTIYDIRDINYDKLIYNTDMIADLIDPKLRSRCLLNSGMKLMSIEFSSLCPDEKSVMDIVRLRQNNKI